MEKRLMDSRGTIEFACVRNFVYIFIFLFFSYFYINCLTISDLQIHIKYIQQFDRGVPALPHFLFHIVVYGISKVSHQSFMYISCLTLASCIMFSTILTERILRHFLKGRYSLTSLTRELNSTGFEIDFQTYIFSLLPVPIFLFRTIPSILGLKKREFKKIQKEHRLPTKGFGKLLKKVFDKEIRALKNKRKILFGASCLIVARASK